MFRKLVLILVIFAFSFFFFGCSGSKKEKPTLSQNPSGGENPSQNEETSIKASLTVLVDPNTTRTVRVVRADGTTATTLGKATLIVDTNGDEKFTSADESYEAVIDSEGKVSFKEVKLPGDGTYKAKLRVEKNGRAPYEKIVELSKDASLTVKVTTTPVQKVTKTVSDTVELARRGEPVYLVFTLRKDAAGARRIEVRTSTRRDVRADQFTELQAVIPASLFPNGTTQVTASMKRFSGVSDRAYFPGRFVGEGAPTRYARRDGSDTYRLKSVAFSLIKLEDQNGNPIEFESKRDGNDTITVTINIPADALSQITEDADNNTAGVQVPIYRYRYWSGDWEYIGVGTLYKYGETDPYTGELPPANGDYYVKFDVPAADWSEYLNIDYPVWFGGEPVSKNVCIKIVNENGTALPWVDVWADGPTYFYDWTDENGLVKFAIPTNNNGTDPLDQIKNGYDFYYAYWPYGISNAKIDANSFTTQDLPSGCDYIAKVTVQNPFNAKAEVHVKDDSGQPVSGQWVDIWSEDYTYWNGGQTDDQGMVSFDVKSGVKYHLYVAGQEKTVNVNGNRDTTGETSDNGYKAIVEIKKQNQAPEVYVWIYPDPVKQGATTTATISAWDPDGDDISLESVTFGGQNVNCPGSGSGGWGYWTCSLNTSDITDNNATLNVTVSDGTKEASATYEVTILAENTNHPPVIYGVMIFDANGTPVEDWDKLKTGTYTFEAFG